jgi:hypothetical protein
MSSPPQVEAIATTLRTAGRNGAASRAAAPLAALLALDGGAASARPKHANGG